MEARPPELIEKIVGILIPMACREHVLGDLYERYTSPGQYVLDALSVLPFLLASRIVRTFRLELLVAQASALYITFAGASIVAGPSYLYDKGALFPLALVIADALLVLLLCDAYADPRDGSPRSAQRHVAVALASVWLLQLVMRFLNPALVLPVWIAAAGTAAAFPVLVMLRTMFRRHGSDAAVSGGLRVALDELRRNSEKQRKTAMRANQLWLLAAAIVFIVTPKVAPPSRWWAIGTALFFVTIIGATLFRVRNVLRYVKRNPYTDPLRSKRDGLLYQASGGLFSILSGSGPSLILCCIAVPLYLFAVRWMMNAPTPDVSLMRVRISLVAFGALCAAWAVVRWLTLRAAETMTRELESRESMDDDEKN
jgi:hypothetical protein